MKNHCVQRVLLVTLRFLETTIIFIKLNLFFHSFNSSEEVKKIVRFVSSEKQSIFFSIRMRV